MFRFKQGLGKGEGEEKGGEERGREEGVEGRKRRKGRGECRIMIAYRVEHKGKDTKQLTQKV